MSEKYIHNNRGCWIEKTENGYLAGHTGYGQSAKKFKTAEEAGENSGLTPEEIEDCLLGDPEI